MKPCWKRLSSGKYVDLNNLQAENLDVKDIETALGGINRFTGHFKDVPPLNVAEHSMLCLQMGRIFEPDDLELHLALLTHDFAEAYIGDVASPVKQVLGDRWYNFATPIEELVELTFYGSYMDPEMHSRVKIYDLASLDIERRVMWSSQYGKDKWPACPLNVGTLEDKQNMFEWAARGDHNIEYEWIKLYKEVVG